MLQHPLFTRLPYSVLSFHDTLIVPISGSIVPVEVLCYSDLFLPPPSTQLSLAQLLDVLAKDSSQVSPSSGILYFRNLQPRARAPCRERSAHTND